MPLERVLACSTYDSRRHFVIAPFTNCSQGAGEAIRGNINAAVDAAAGDRQSAARNEQIASRGASEMDQGYHRAGAGTHGQHTTGGSSNYGPHGTNVGNKLDPRFDSDMGMSSRSKIF